MLLQSFAAAAAPSKQRLLCLLGLAFAASIRAFEPQISLAHLASGQGLTMYGSDYNELSGTAVCGAGDVNGDGFGDVLVGAPFAKSATTTGRAFLVFGGESADAVVKLDEMPAGKGFVLTGVHEADGTGSAVAIAGDLNGDGFDDLVVGAPGANGEDGGAPVAGATFVVFGSNNIGASGSIDLTTLDGTTGFAVHGQAVNDQSGYSVAGAGDFNGDGVKDLIIGAPSRAVGVHLRAGVSYVIYGSATLGSSGAFDLASLDGSNGFVIQGSATDAAVGSSVSSAGDVNNDGFDDILVGALGDDETGAAYIIFGGANVAPTGSLSVADLTGTKGVRLAGVDNGDLCGTSVGHAGDVNGDGFADVVIGAPGAAGLGNAAAETGEAYVVYGGDSLSSISLGELTGTSGFVVYGSAAGQLVGTAVSSAGDTNADGFADLLIGAPGFDGVHGNMSSSGATYVLFGGESVGAAAGVVRLQDFVAGTNGFVAYGGAARDKSGSAVAAVTSFHKKAVTDLIVAAPNANGYMDEQGATGATYVLFGGASTPDHDHDDDGDDDTGLSVGAIAGIAAVSAVAVAGLAGGAYLYKKSKTAEMSKPLLNDVI